MTSADEILAAVTVVVSYFIVVARGILIECVS